MSLLRLSGVFGIKVALFVFVIAYISTGAGITAAGDDTTEYAELRGNLTGAAESALANATENSTAEERATTKATVGPMFEVFETVIGTSFDFGYHHPTLARWYTNISPMAVLGGLGLYAYGWYREFRGPN